MKVNVRCQEAILIVMVLRAFKFARIYSKLFSERFFVRLLLFIEVLVRIDLKSEQIRSLESFEPTQKPSENYKKIFSHHISVIPSLCVLFSLRRPTELFGDINQLSVIVQNAKAVSWPTMV